MGGILGGLTGLGAGGNPLEKGGQGGQGSYDVLNRDSGLPFSS